MKNYSIYEDNIQNITNKDARKFYEETDFPNTFCTNFLTFFEDNKDFLDLVNNDIYTYIGVIPCENSLENNFGF